MLRTMKFCVDTKDEGLFLKPNAKWDGKNKDFKFEITGESDSTFASDPKTMKSV